MAVSNFFSLVARPFVKAFGHAKFADVAEQFLTEAAVLVFVFPVLDTIVQFGTGKVKCLNKAEDSSKNDC
jgi:hypothetical protein